MTHNDHQFAQMKEYRAAKASALRHSRKERNKLCKQQVKQYPHKVERYNADMLWRVHFNGAELAAPVVVDFWPYTGRYKTRDGAIKGTANHFDDFVKEVETALAYIMVTG